MGAQEAKKKTKLSKKARKKRGLIYLLVAVVCFVIWFIMEKLNHDPIAAFIIIFFTLLTIIFFISGLINFIAGFVGKD